MRTNDEKNFLNICCQIKDAHAEGYYITILDDKTGKPEMDKEGNIITYPIFLPTLISVGIGIVALIILILLFTR